MDFASAFNFAKKLDTTRRKLPSSQSADQFFSGATPFHIHAPADVSCERLVVHAPAPGEQKLALTMRKWKGYSVTKRTARIRASFSAGRFIRPGGYEHG
jgi:hypothetical protein